MAGPPLGGALELPARPGTTPIADVVYRRRTRVIGRVHAIRVAPLHDAPTLELVLVDGTGSISLVFLGRRRLAAVEIGSVLVADGTAGLHRGRLALLNPTYEMVPTSG